MISSKSTHENVPKEQSPDGDDIPDGTDSKTPKTTANQDDRKSFKCNLNVHLAYGCEILGFKIESDKWEVNRQLMG